MSQNLKFTPEDFAQMGYGPGYRVQMHAAEIAQAKFDEWIAQAPEVFGVNDGDWQSRHRIDGWEPHTHRARLVNIEEIK